MSTTTHFQPDHPTARVQRLTESGTVTLAAVDDSPLGPSSVVVFFDDLPALGAFLADATLQADKLQAEQSAAEEAAPVPGLVLSHRRTKRGAAAAEEEAAALAAIKAEARAALIAGAFTEPPDEDDPLTTPRTIVHSFAAGGGMMIGADWDLEDAVAFLDTATDVQWIEGFAGHDLYVAGPDMGLDVLQRTFEVKRSAWQPLLAEDLAASRERPHSVPCRNCQRMTWEVTAVCVRCQHERHEDEMAPRRVAMGEPS